MFDNEIDWVMRIWRLFLVPAAARQLEGWVTGGAIQGRAQAMNRRKMIQAKCSK